jgi:hypothetical protein
MDPRLLRLFAISVVVVGLLTACQRGNPMQPSVARLDAASPPVVVPVTIRLRNIEGHFVGTSHEMCELPGEPMAIDRLSFDYEISGASLAGASLVSCDTAYCEDATRIATVTDCDVPRDACARVPSACLTGDPNGAGSLEVLAARPLEPASTWNVMAVFEDSGDRSNAVSAIVDHTAAAPIAAQ